MNSEANDEAIDSTDSKPKAKRVRMKSLYKQIASQVIPLCCWRMSLAFLSLGLGQTQATSGLRRLMCMTYTPMRMLSLDIFGRINAMNNKSTDPILTS